MAPTDRIVLTVETAADAATVWDLVATQDGQRAFWTDDCDVPTEVGEVARFGFPEAPVDVRMRVDQLDEGKLVAWTCLGDFPGWADSTVTWELSDAQRLPGGGTRVVLVHAGVQAPDDGELGFVAHTWASILGRLDRVATSGTADPFFPAA